MPICERQSTLFFQVKMHAFSKINGNEGVNFSKNLLHKTLTRNEMQKRKKREKRAGDMFQLWRLKHESGQEAPKVELGSRLQRE